MNRIFDGIEKVTLRGVVAAARPGVRAGSTYLHENGRVYAFNYVRNGMDFLWKNVKLRSNKVVVPAFICPVVVNVLERNGLEPVFVDVREDDFTLDLEALSKIDLDDIGAVIANHTFGFPMDIDGLRSKWGGVIFEDATHAWGTQRSGRHVGMDGDFSGFSFYKQTPNYNGGLLWSREQDLSEPYQTLRREIYTLRDIPLHALHTHGPHQAAAHALRKQKDLIHLPPEAVGKTRRVSRVAENLFFQAYPKLLGEIEGRRRVARWYDSFADERFFVPQQSPHPNALPSYYRYNIRLKPAFAPFRDQIGLELRRRGVFVDRLWFDAPHRGLPAARQLADSVLNLPIKSTYTRKNVESLFVMLYEVFHSHRA